MIDKFQNYQCPVKEENCVVIDKVSDLQQRTLELEKQVLTDALTGLVNFRGFRQQLDQEMERTRRLEQPTSLIMIDIDHFKQVNDRYGHDVGNQALAHLAGLLGRTLRKLDIPCRYGGEEFALILPSTALAPAVLVAERIRLLVDRTPLETAKGKIPFTISLGVATYLAMDDLDAENLIKQADAFLYQAKQTGRNTTCHPPIDRRQQPAAVGSKERQEIFAAFGRKKNS